MKFAIIISSLDQAGITIKSALLKQADFVVRDDIYTWEQSEKKITLYTIHKDTIHYESVADDIEADFYIFATKHVSKSGAKTLCIHFPGNFGDAQFGGKNNKVCLSPAKLLKKIYNEMHLNNDTEYDVTLEATHHGPFVNKPVLFIEIGSGSDEWNDKNAGRVIAKSLITGLIKYDPNEVMDVALAFGGTHYCAAFNKIELNSDIALSHICPKHNINLVTKDLMDHLITSSFEKVNYALLDWKGMDSAQRNHIVHLLDDFGIRWKKTKEVNIFKE